MSHLYIPNSIALRNFDSLFKSNNFDFSDKKVDIGFHPEYVAMHPIGLAFYAAMADRFQTEGIETRASINYSIRSIPYLQRMGLFRVFNFQDPVQITEHEEAGRFIPLMKINDSAQLTAFIRTVDPILHTTRDNSRVIKHVFSELLRNVLEHSRAPLGGNVCATYNRKRAKISIGISDAGIGILESMRYHHHLASHVDSLITALKPGFSGTTSRIGGTAENAGAGLFFTKCIAQSTRNHFLVYSGNAYFKLKLTPAGQDVQFNANPNADYKTIRDALPFFQGTLIGIDVNIEDSNAFNNLIDNIGTAYQLNVKRTKKDYYRRIRFT
jgi:hypothetical protein